MELVIGTKRWSSWSLRPWLALKRTGQSFKEIEIELRRGDATTHDIAAYSPSKLAPALRDGDLVVWDSLAICEYLAEKFPEAKLWPTDPALRALGRSASAEMHSGFQSLRGECPMALDEAPRKLDISEATQKDVRKIIERWNQLLKRSGGPFLLGEWSIADAFYTPVATRFRTYGIHPSDHGDAGAAGAYAERLLETPEFLEWESASRVG
ncbi:glutathione S-transferase family protein [Caulobacter segnis]|uniref:glutathione S-transferase family protein n=1 Tax=Caulobacter segnis TaxID=88688 RepID=UPI00285FB874|nr:glutathione S-transferase family protein [Caulobacter segnis]MDR6627833.1 glutathione S-transferase [Caulobacter segnis]